MERTGTAELPLHGGRCPPWLFGRMRRLGGVISEIIVDEYGTREFLRRISEPHFFQALGCVLGFDWHSSGVTTTVCGALKEALKEKELGLKVAGGKASVGRKAALEIKVLSKDYSLSDKKLHELAYASRMSAKVDNAALQDSYLLYHHCIFFDECGNWGVVQQGLNQKTSYARRYHWLGEGVENFVSEPRSAVCCDRREKQVLDLSAKNSKEVQNVSVELAREGAKRIGKDFKIICDSRQKNLLNWDRKQEEKMLMMPRRINWSIMKRLYDAQPENYEELVAFRGVGSETLKALALIAEVVYGEEASWRDPVKYSFAHGGKDGVPRPIDRAQYDRSIEILEDAVKLAKLEEREKLYSLKKIAEMRST